MKITITGDLYSGKSVLSKKLCEHYNLNFFSVGTLMRRNAEVLGMNITEYNKYMEEHCLDNIIDSTTREIGLKEEDFIFDARLAWNFIEDSIKIYLKVNIEEAVKRALKAQRGFSEMYSSEEEARESIEERSKLERERFMELYQVDIYNLHNYDLILDTSLINEEQVFSQIIHYIDMIKK